ncbi:MAG: hypothetical protein ILO34_07305, partial [Kiritimatiellae bacterium]|nr:hypothetical protein [Kiritimatiellia bacterium]
MKKTMFCAAALSVFSLFGAWSDGIDTAYMSSFSLDGDAEFTGISIYGGLVLSGDGTLSFSGVAPLTASGQYFGAPPVDIAVNGGGIRTYAGEIADLPDEFDAGALVHFDASLPETLVTTNDATHICKWLDARPEMRSSVYAWADNPGDNGFCKEWPTIGSGDASLPGGTFVDFGSYMEGGWGTTDSSYMLYPAQNYIREGFIVLRINGGMSFFLGSSLGYTDFHRGNGGQLMTYDLDYWRANGFRVQSG